MLSIDEDIVTYFERGVEAKFKKSQKPGE